MTANMLTTKFCHQPTVTSDSRLCVIGEEQMLTDVRSELAQEVEVIFKEHARLVYRTAYGVTGNHEDAEDVLQTIFLQLIRQECSPDFGKNPQAYLYRASTDAPNLIGRSIRNQSSPRNKGGSRIRAYGWEERTKVWTDVHGNVG